MPSITRRSGSPPSAPSLMRTSRLGVVVKALFQRRIIASELELVRVLELEVHLFERERKWARAEDERQRGGLGRG
ncbi:hypothetical protein LP419_21155 [Massilia sp. H-1]|nr:hypothetical protein LP419_21155 [Massilia sp. H-1]